MKHFGMMMAMALVCTNASAALQVTCVCSKYALASDRSTLVLATEELYTTSQMSRVEECNDLADEADRAAEINTRKHFNCKGVAKEDLRNL